MPQFTVQPNKIAAVKLVSGGRQVAVKDSPAAGDSLLIDGIPSELVGALTTLLAVEPSGDLAAIVFTTSEPKKVGGDPFFTATYQSAEIRG